MRKMLTGQLITLLAAAALVRVLWAVSVQGEQVSDARGYELMATQLAAGNYFGFDGTAYTYWPVGYPFFLSLHYRLFGDAWWPIAISNILLSVTIVALTVVVARQWLGNDRLALFAGWLIAVYPVHIQFVSITSGEALFTVLLLGSVMVMGAKAKVRTSRSVGGGTLLGLASFVRPVAMLLAPAIVCARVAAGRHWSRALVEGIAAGIIAMIVVSPWTYRNYRLYDRYVFVSTNGGVCFYHGNNPQFPDRWQAIEEPPFEGNDAEREKYCKSLAIEYIKSDPIGFAARSLRKAVRLWERDTIGAHWNADGIGRRFGEAGVWYVKAISQAYWVLLLAAGAFGAVVVVRRFGWAKLLSGVGVWLCLAFTVLHAITYSQDRYHFPLVPFVAILAAAPFALRSNNRFITATGHAVGTTDEDAT